MPKRKGAEVFDHPGAPQHTAQTRLKVNAMSDAEYNEVSAMPLEQLRTLNCWKLARYLSRCGHIRRAMILQAIAA